MTVVRFFIERSALSLFNHRIESKKTLKVPQNLRRVTRGS